MILFFYGSNEYLLTRKLRELKDRYQKSSGGNFDLINLEGAELTFEKFSSQVQAMALFATTRFVIIENIFSAPKDVQDKIKGYLDKISQSTVVIFIARGEPDKRLGLFKALNKPKISHNFAKISEDKLPDFVYDETISRGGRIDRQVAQYLAQSVGNDFWQLSQEIDKLITYRGSAEIRKEDIDLLVAKNLTSNVFTMIDDLVQGRKGLALKELKKLYLNNEPPLKILGAINYQVRIIAQVVDVGADGNPYALSKQIGIQYFQIKNVIDLCKKLTSSDILKIYKCLLHCDHSIKTGKIEPEEGLKELILSI
jgi:DNA polymerase-3 subunit delta